jgi:hypothetical protein
MPTMILTVDPLPLSIADAAAAIEQKLDQGKVIVIKAELFNYTSPNIPQPNFFKGRFFYAMTVLVLGSHENFVVLMDGTVLTPKVETLKKKAP